MEITRSRIIGCPRDVLFEYLREPNNDPDWCTTVRSSELVDGETGEPGAVYDQMHKPGPFPPSALRVKLLEIDPPSTIRLKSVDDVARFVVTYTLDDLGDGTTRVTQHDDIEFRGFGRLIAPFIALAVRSGIKRQFADLAAKAERNEIATVVDDARSGNSTS